MPHWQKYILEEIQRAVGMQLFDTGAGLPTCASVLLARKVLLLLSLSLLQRNKFYVAKKQ
jgi:hypothetical protein